MQMLPGVSVRQQTPPPLPSRNTPAAQFSLHGEVHHHLRDNSPQVTCQQSCSSRKRLNHLRFSSPVCSGGHLSCWREISHDRDDRERHLILADWAKLVGRLGVCCGVLSEFTLRWRGQLCYFTRLDCGANALTVCNTVRANVLLDSRSEWMAAKGVEEIRTHEEICVQYDRALHVHIAPPTRTQLLRDTIGLVHGVLEVDGSPVLLTTRLKGSATMSLPRKNESVRREPLRVDMVETLERGDCVEAVSWTQLRWVRCFNLYSKSRVGDLATCHAEPDLDWWRQNWCHRNIPS